MLVTKTTYDRDVRFWKNAYAEQLGVASDARTDAFKATLKVNGEEDAHRFTKIDLASAELALAAKDDQIEELQAEVYELTRSRDNWKGVADSRDSIVTKVANKLDEANARADRAESALAAATKVSYVVALHENDVPAQPRHSSLDMAYAEYREIVDGENGRNYPYRIFALRGDRIIADVTSPSTWDERLPVSEARQPVKFQDLSSLFANWNKG